MAPNRKTTIVAGVLILISVAASVVGGTQILSVIKVPSFLANIPSNTTHMFIGVLLELTCAALVVWIPITLFPILKQHSEKMAVAFVIFRSIEAVFTIVCEVMVLSLVTLGQEYAGAGASDASYLSTLATAVVAGHYWAYDMVCIATGIAYLILFYLCSKSRLLPRFLSIWGLVGMPIFLILVLSGILANHPGMLFRGEYPANIIVLPASLNELFLAVWLIFKGFTPSRYEKDRA